MANFAEGTYFQLIRSRSSVRTFAFDPTPREVIAELENLVSQSYSGPFGASCRFGLVDTRSVSVNEINKLSSYGVIKNPHGYLIGAVRKGDRCLVDYGYTFQKILLKAARLGLGTCWLGGTFRREKFTSLFPLTVGEIIPAVSPFGIPAKKRSIIEGVLSWGVSSKLRRPWDQLFFTPNGLPLKEEDVGKLHDALEAVRLAPSAVNRQPWRIVVDEQNVSFFLDAGVEYRHGSVRLSELDLGIALFHFESVQREQGGGGLWAFDPPHDNLGRPNWEYIVSWVPQGA